MYVDSSTACNDLNFVLGQTAQGTTLASRSWSVRVTQIECGSDSLAPEGCTQYFYGSDTGNLKTFNYDGGYHLSNQNQVQCIRREKGNCKICYSTSTNTDLAVSGNAASAFDTVDCCWYKADGMGTMRDCVIIPSLSKTTGAPLKFGNFCGRAGLGTAAGALTANAIKTICSTKTF